MLPHCNYLLPHCYPNEIANMYRQVAPNKEDKEYDQTIWKDEPN